MIKHFSYAIIGLTAILGLGFYPSLAVSADITFTLNSPPGSAAGVGISTGQVDHYVALSDGGNTVSWDSGPNVVNNLFFLAAVNNDGNPAAKVDFDDTCKNVGFIPTQTNGTQFLHLTFEWTGNIITNHLKTLSFTVYLVPTYAGSTQFTGKCTYSDSQI